MIYKIMRTITNTALSVLPTKFTEDSYQSTYKAKLLFIAFEKRDSLHLGSQSWRITIQLVGALSLKIHNSQMYHRNNGWEELTRYVKFDSPQIRENKMDEIPF